MLKLKDIVLEDLKKVRNVDKYQRIISKLHVFVILCISITYWEILILECKLNSPWNYYKGNKYNGIHYTFFFSAALVTFIQQ